MSMKKIIIISAILSVSASASFAVDQSEYWKSPQMAEGMRNCVFSEALIGAAKIHEARAFGMNYEYALGTYCSNMMGFMWRCQSNNQSPEFCADIVMSFARDGIDRALEMAGY